MIKPTAQFCFRDFIPAAIPETNIPASLCFEQDVGFRNLRVSCAILLGTEESPLLGFHSKPVQSPKPLKAF